MMKMGVLGVMGHLFLRGQLLLVESGAEKMVGKLGYQRKNGYINGKMNISTEIFIYQRK